MGSVYKSIFIFIFIKKNDMRRERDSRARFVSRGKSSIPTSPLIPPQLRSATPSSQTHIPSITDIHRLPEVLRYEIQPKYSLTSSIEAVIEEEDLASPTEGVIFLSSIGEKLVGQELEIPSEEEEEETYFNIPLIEEPEEIEEELEQPILEPYISYEEYTMEEEGEGEVHNVNGEQRRTGGGRGGNIGGGRGGGRGREGGRGGPKPF